IPAPRGCSGRTMPTMRWASPPAVRGNRSRSRRSYASAAAGKRSRTGAKVARVRRSAAGRAPGPGGEEHTEEPRGIQLSEINPYSYSYTYTYAFAYAKIRPGRFD